MVTRFFVVLALWPWPLPWTTQNMDAIAENWRVDGTALERSIGRHISTAFIVPLPCSSQPRGWNMTHSVQVANQQFILREAWVAAMQFGDPVGGEDPVSSSPSPGPQSSVGKPVGLPP